MRWLHRRRHPVETDPTPDVDQAAADEAVCREQKARAEQEARWSTIDEVTAAAHAHERENHFAELVAMAMRRKRAW